LRFILSTWLFVFSLSPSGRARNASVFSSFPFPNASNACANSGTAQDAREVLQRALAASGEVEAAQLPVEAVVHEADGEVEEEVATHGLEDSLDVEAVAEEAVQHGPADEGAVFGLGRDVEGPGAEGLAAGAEGAVLGVVDVEGGHLAVGEGADTTVEEAFAPPALAAVGAGMGLGGAADDADDRHEHGPRSWEVRG